MEALNLIRKQTVAVTGSKQSTHEGKCKNKNCIMFYTWLLSISMKKLNIYQRREKVDCQRKKVDLLHESLTGWGRSLSLWQSSSTERRKGEEAQRDSSPASSKVIQPRHPPSAEKYGVKIFPPTRATAVRRERTLTEENHWPSNKLSIHIE